MTDDSLSRKRQVDQIADEFEAKWNIDQSPEIIEEYLDRIDVQYRDELIELLLTSDLEFRQKHKLVPRGLSPTAITPWPYVTVSTSSTCTIQNLFLK